MDIVSWTFMQFHKSLAFGDSGQIMQHVLATPVVQISLHVHMQPDNVLGHAQGYIACMCGLALDPNTATYPILDPTLLVELRPH